MRPFDCTAKEAPLWGCHLLEASAGTGKTFAIEHVVCRMLLEDPSLLLEEILAITFTRAAARDLKNRIRTTLVETLAFLQTGETSVLWPYLIPWRGSGAAKGKIEKSLASFESASISTIHGFCHRALKEFSFEARLPFSFQNWGENGTQGKRKERERIVRFLKQEVGEPLITPAQLLLLLRSLGSWEDLAEEVRKTSALSEPPLPTPSKELLSISFDLPSESEFLGAFEEFSPNYKKIVKGNFSAQAKALYALCQAPEKKAPFDFLLQERGTLFRFLSPENRKVKAAGFVLPPFWEKACFFWGPRIREAADPKKLLFLLSYAWQKREKEKGAEPLWTPDLLLHQMGEALKETAFTTALQKKYKAGIIDEFQDTDPAQWALLKPLLLERPEPLKALYLVGDPKQSIYRFRSADIYTYFSVKKRLGEEAFYSLSTNYRSTKPLIEALNALFSRVALPLPKLGEAMPIPKVEAGSGIEPVADGKKALEIWMAEGEGDFFSSLFLPHAVLEVQTLLEKGIAPRSFAFLVKDRYQGKAAASALAEAGIPAFLRNGGTLGETATFAAYKQMFEALLFPEEPFRRRLVEAGPWRGKLLPERAVLEKGLLSFFKEMPQMPLEIDAGDAKQLTEELLLWEKRQGFSLDGLKEALEEIALRSAEEGGRRALSTEEDAVAIMTLHGSKGLEFDIVFGLGLCSSHPGEGKEEAEEQKAEQLRQLYVGMTRAKKRLYLPLRTGSSGRGVSPSDLFYEQIAEGLETVSPHLNVTVLQRPPEGKKTALPAPSFSGEEKKRMGSFVEPRWTRSFTSLKNLEGRDAPGTEERFDLFSSEEAFEKPLFLEPSQESRAVYTIHTMPKGADTGIAVHRILERLFASSLPLEKILEEELQATSLAPWIGALAAHVKRALHLPFLPGGGSLSDLAKGDARAEIPFLYGDPPHLMKGIIDLLFRWKGKYYLLDWKTNWLGENEESYREKNLSVAMEQEKYGIQAALYAEALQRHLRLWGKGSFGGSYYLFIRGPAVYFIPEAQNASEIG